METNSDQKFYSALTEIKRPRGKRNTHLAKLLVKEGTERPPGTGTGRDLAMPLTDADGKVVSLGTYRL